MEAARILKPAMKTVAVMLLVPAFVAVGYSFGQKQEDSKNIGATVTLVGKVEKIKEESLFIATLKSPLEGDTKGAKAEVMVIKNTGFRKITLEEGQRASQPQKISYGEIKNGDMVTILAELVGGGKLRAKEVVVVPPVTRENTSRRKPPSGEALKSMKTVDGTVKEIGDKRFVVEITTGITVTVLTDEETSYTRGEAGREGKKEEGSFSDIKPGGRVIVGGEESSAGTLLARAIFIIEGAKR